MCFICTSISHSRHKFNSHKEEDQQIELVGFQTLLSFEWLCIKKSNVVLSKCTKTGECHSHTHGTDNVYHLVKPTIETKTSHF